MPRTVCSPINALKLMWRSTMETDAGYDPKLWLRLGEMGIVGLMVDEAQGGSGVGPMELEAVMEEVGAALLCSPLLASGVVAAELLRALGDDAANDRLLPGIASGRTIATAALTGDSGCWTAAGVSVAAEDVQGGWQLAGNASYVLHGQNADLLLVVAKTADGLAAFEVDPAVSGISISALPTFDHTLRLASITFDGAAGRRINAAASVWDAVQQAIDLALVALAGEQAGGAQRVLRFHR